MSARLTDEIGEAMRAAIHGCLDHGGQCPHEEKCGCGCLACRVFRRDRADRAAILESERDLLAALESERHVVKFGATQYGLEHPVRCRADLLGCEVNQALVLLDGPPLPEGKYDVRLVDGELVYGPETPDPIAAALANARKQDAPTGAGGGKG